MLRIVFLIVFLCAAAGAGTSGNAEPRGPVGQGCGANC